VTAIIDGHPEHQERVFGVFERLEGGDDGGTGNGLATDRRSVGSIGGRIGLAKRDDGAEFPGTAPRGRRRRASAHPRTGSRVNRTVRTLVAEGDVDHRAAPAPPA
jgi:hypothetical protein